MPKVRVTLTSNLKKYYPQARFEIEADSLRELLRKMDATRPNFSSYILEDSGAIRKHVNIFLDGHVVEDRKSSDLPLNGKSEVHIMQALSGG